MYINKYKTSRARHATSPLHTLLSEGTVTITLLFPYI